MTRCLATTWTCSPPRCCSTWRLGVVALALLPLRRRRPLLVAGLTAALSSVSASAVGASTLAAVSMSTRRRWAGAAVVGVVWAVAGAFYQGLYRPALPGVESSIPYMLVTGAVTIAVYVASVATGFYIGARRELLDTLQERAETAEREQALKADAAREAERTRIAREMHDVLAHRISLVAMHAGALTYRTDLTPAETAGLPRSSRRTPTTRWSSSARCSGCSAPGPQDLEGQTEPPQPSLRELGSLLAETAEAGTPVRLDADGLAEPGGAAPPRAGRTRTRSRRYPARCRAPRSGSSKRP